MTYLQAYLTADLNLEFHERVKRGEHSTFNGVFHRNNPVSSAPLLNFGKHLIDRLKCLVTGRVTKISDPGLMGKGGFRAQIGDHNVFLGKSAGSYYLMKNRA